MFAKLFAESGLSLDRLRALLEVGAAGSIVKAAGGDPVRQSQFSRQIKELEAFFRTTLIERQGKGTRLTPDGRELARISRFFMLGLANFQRGCLAEQQTFRIGGSATFLREFLLPAISSTLLQAGARYVTEVSSDGEIERRLHDLTLDFGVVTAEVLSRPLQRRELGKWKLELWLPRALGFSEAKAVKAFASQQLPLALAQKELEGFSVLPSAEYEACLVCDSFLEAKAALENQRVGAVLPDFLAPAKATKGYVRVRVPSLETSVYEYALAWNPRLMRLNPPAARKRDRIAEALISRMPN